jgi:hypothetical protein
MLANEPFGLPILKRPIERCAVIYSTHDTEWASSSRGNEWRRISGLVLVTGRARSGTHFWGMIDGDFIDGFFEDEAAAKEACERRAAFLLDVRGY